MYIRRAFQNFLHLQSDAERPASEQPAGIAADRTWPMDHAPRPARSDQKADWTLDWRWFCAEGER